MVAPIALIEQVIQKMDSATQANRQTAGRQGCLVRVAEGGDVMVTGDLHGNMNNFAKIRRAAALENHPSRHLILQEVVHGGPVYENGGCMSHQLLENVARLKGEFPDRVHLMLANHELSEATDFPISKSELSLNTAFQAGLDHVYGIAASKVKEAYHRFILSCPLAVELPGGVFVSHSCPEETQRVGFDLAVLDRTPTDRDLAPEGDAFRLVWGRDYSPQNALAFAELVGASVLIHGHDPCPGGYHTPNEYQVILDCCHKTACFALLECGRGWDLGGVVEQIRDL